MSDPAASALLISPTRIGARRPKAPGAPPTSQKRLIDSHRPDASIFPIPEVGIDDVGPSRFGLSKQCHRIAARRPQAPGAPPTSQKRLIDSHRPDASIFPIPEVGIEPT